MQIDDNQKFYSRKAFYRLFVYLVSTFITKNRDETENGVKDFLILLFPDQTFAFELIFVLLAML